MNDLRQELQRLIALNNAERWLPEHIAFRELFDLHGDGLIPGLIECVGDKVAEVRVLAISLLDVAGESAKDAVPVLVRAVDDDDQLVRVAAAHCIGKFGPLALAAVPSLLPWLQDDHEYVRLLAAVTILRLDPASGNEAIPVIKAAMAEGDPAMKELVREFLAELIGDVLPPLPRLMAMTHRQVRDESGANVIEAAKKIGMELTDDDLGDITDLFAGLHWPVFDPRNYNRHC